MPDYVLPALAKAGTDPEEIVRCALATHIGSLAETAGRFLEIAQWMRTLTLRRDSNSGFNSGSLASLAGGVEAIELRVKSYDAELATLQEQVSRLVVQLLTDADSGPTVKRLMLDDITRLCVFMQRQNT